MCRELSSLNRDPRLGLLQGAAEYVAVIVGVAEDRRLNVGVALRYGPPCGWVESGLGFISRAETAFGPHFAFWPHFTY